MSAGPDIPLLQQIACVQREIAMRVGVYGGLIAKGKMTVSKAHFELEAMRAVLKTLEELNRGTGTPAGQ